MKGLDGEEPAGSADAGSAGGERRVRALGLAGVVVIAAGLIGWAALRQGDAVGAGDLPQAPVVTPPPPGSAGQGGVAPEPARGAEEPAIARPAADTAGPESETPEAGDRGEGEAAEPKAPETGDRGENEAAADPAAPEPEGEAAKKRGKRPVRKKAGTTDAGPAGPSPKIKTDVYDE